MISDIMELELDEESYTICFEAMEMKVDNVARVRCIRGFVPNDEKNLMIKN